MVALGEVVVNLLSGDAHGLQYLPEIFTCVLEHRGSVLGE